MQVKCQLISSEGEKVRVRFAYANGNQIVDFLLAANHPLVVSSRVGVEYELNLTPVEQEGLQS